jgi:ABC-type antimicrobial peptide transport system permease subunit
MACGASPTQALGLVLRQGLFMTSIGIVLGVAGAMALTRFLSSYLFGVGPLDPITFIGASLLLGAVALLACYVPARRAARIDPMAALRYE